MTTAELQARAIARAHDEHIYIRRVTNRPGVYTARSRTNPHRRYILVDRDGTQACSCPGFTNRASCKHVEGLRQRLAREGQQLSLDLQPAGEPLAHAAA
ncbi:MAG TPA: hypothetical protein VKV26_09345 [Dehalococcoidia bacterium]|nr:hypothetical protein [Dehalococcoidia bacterium]